MGWGGNATAMPVSGWSHYHQAEQARLAQQQSGNLGGGANDANMVGGSNTKPPKAPGQKDDSSPLDDFSRTLAARAAAAWAALKGRRREEEGDGQDNSSEGGNGTDGLDTDGLLAAPFIPKSPVSETNDPASRLKAPAPPGNWDMGEDLVSRTRLGIVEKNQLHHQTLSVSAAMGVGLTLGITSVVDSDGDVREMHYIGYSPGVGVSGGYTSGIVEVDDPNIELETEQFNPAATINVGIGPLSSDINFFSSASTGKESTRFPKTMVDYANGFTWGDGAIGFVTTVGKMTLNYIDREERGVFLRPRE